jgi:hypothetical protein
MRELNDDNLDTLLREHFASQLDGQLDKARYGQLDRAPAAFARSSRRRPWRAVVWPLALAAGIAAVFVLPALLRRGEKPALPGPQVAQITSSPSVEHEIAWNTIDQGTVFIADDQPMRSIRRERTDSFRWIDPETSALMELSIPHNEIVLVGMSAY